MFFQQVPCVDNLATKSYLCVTFKTIKLRQREKVKKLKLNDIKETENVTENIATTETKLKLKNCKQNFN